MTSRASVTIYTEADRERVARWAKDTGIGTVVEFRKKSRSTEQNAKLWAMLTEVSEQVVWYGQKLDTEDWKTIFTASLRKANVLPGIDAGTVVPLGISTSTMTIDEMGNLIELIYAFGAQHEPPVNFKDPKPETDDAASLPASGSDDESLPSDPSSDDEPAPSAASSQEDADPTAPPREAASSTLFQFNFADGELLHLKDFARKALADAGSTMDLPAKEAAVQLLFDSYLDAIESEDGRKALRAMEKPLSTVMAGKRTKAQAQQYIATELLDCAAGEIGDRDNG